MYIYIYHVYIYPTCTSIPRIYLHCLTGAEGELSTRREKNSVGESVKPSLDGGFKYFLFSHLPGDLGR